MSNMTNTLTDAQSRMLHAVCRDGERIYNGRATRTIQRLRDLGLVTVDLDYVDRSGGGAQYVARWTVRPTVVPGVRIRFRRQDCTVQADTVRECVWQRTTSESGLAFVLTEHSWCWASDVLSVVAP